MPKEEDLTIPDEAENNNPEPYTNVIHCGEYSIPITESELADTNFCNQVRQAFDKHEEQITVLNNKVRFNTETDSLLPDMTAQLDYQFRHRRLTDFEEIFNTR